MGGQTRWYDLRRESYLVEIEYPSDAAVAEWKKKNPDPAIADERTTCKIVVIPSGACFDGVPDFVGAAEQALFYPKVRDIRLLSVTNLGPAAVPLEDIPEIYRRKE